MSDFELSVRHALLDRGMSMTDLASELGISNAYLYDIMNGARQADAQKERIKKFLQLEGGEA